MGVKTLLADPKKAILKLAWPMMIAMSLQTVYNVVDAIWVSGLGSDALSAVGFFFPFFFALIAIATGLGVGGGAFISQYIGAKNKKLADSVATHTFVLTIVVFIIICIPLMFFSEHIFVALGAGSIIHLLGPYAKIIFGGSFFIFFSMVANAVLRAEGDAKRSMYALMVGAGLNIVLDPLFIYTFGFGVSGAAIATVISVFVASLIIAYWLFFKSDSYLNINFRSFKFDWFIVKQIFSVGIPTALQQFSMAVMMLFLNYFLVFVGGTDAVAVFSTGWRVVTFAILPLVGVATAVVSVSGAAFGAKKFNNLKIAFLFSTKLGLIIAVVGGVLTFVFAPQIAFLFTFSKNSAHIAPQLIAFLRTICWFYPFTPLGMFSSSFFQGVGLGIRSLIITLLRTLVFVLLFCLLFTFVFSFGEFGVWLGVVIGNGLGSVIAFGWAYKTINSFLKTNSATSKK